MAIVAGVVVSHHVTRKYGRGGPKAHTTFSLVGVTPAVEEPPPRVLEAPPQPLELGRGGREHALAAPTRKPRVRPTRGDLVVLKGTHQSPPPPVGSAVRTRVVYICKGPLWVLGCWGFEFHALAAPPRPPHHLRLLEHNREGPKVRDLDEALVPPERVRDDDGHTPPRDRVVELPGRRRVAAADHAKGAVPHKRGVLLTRDAIHLEVP
mmetsp:Transcript_27754/g.61936  ORF Transcript_27754/g.61936 Transcript_27754/m.61936 type:complete len:208 (+) Transcript_27754:354-977(+)